MNSELLNPTINEITTQTLAEWYNVTQSNLETIQNKLKNTNDSVWLQIGQMALSDDFIRDFKEKLNWDWISTNLPLNENFIEEFQDFVDWEAISEQQNLSEEFIRDH
jgi:type I site-specific restriction endonuclease